VEFLHQPVPFPVNNELKQQGDGAGETLKNDKLRALFHHHRNVLFKQCVGDW
jgi:hypothetical protein